MKALNILVPTDFSEASRKAMRTAYQWVSGYGGRITPLHAYEAITDLDGFHFYGPDQTFHGDINQIEKAIRELLDTTARQDVDEAHLCQGIFVMNRSAISIARASIAFDLVIISSHGRSGFSRFFLGSVTDKVIRLCPAPVLVVHHQTPLFPIGRIVVPTDLSFNSEIAFPTAVELANASGADIDVLYVYASEGLSSISTDALEERARAFAVPHFQNAIGAVNVRTLVTGTSVHEAIYRFVQENPCSLIVMSTTGRTGLENHLLGTTPAQVVREVPTNVLLVNPQQQRDFKLKELTLP